jgi:hypothetical protein
MNDPAGTGDTCPQAVLDKVDLDDLKEQYDVLSAFKNGPRLWCLDWAEVMVGELRDFSGLQARWVMWQDVPKEMRKHESVAYKPPEAPAWVEFPARSPGPGPGPHPRCRSRPDHPGRPGQHLRPRRRPVQQLQAMRYNRPRAGRATYMRAETAWPAACRPGLCGDGGSPSPFPGPPARSAPRPTLAAMAAEAEAPRQRSARTAAANRPHRMQKATSETALSGVTRTHSRGGPGGQAANCRDLRHSFRASRDLRPVRCSAWLATMTITTNIGRLPWATSGRT